jgi:hypothetical protein
MGMTDFMVRVALRGCVGVIRECSEAYVYTWDMPGKPTYAGAVPFDPTSKVSQLRAFAAACNGLNAHLEALRGDQPQDHVH